MKQLEKSDLKIGEIYKNVNGDTIFLCQSNKKNYGDGFRISTKIFARNNYFDRFSIDLNFLEATPEEKHWLETCIKADKFVSYEEAMKTFIPEFVLPKLWCIKLTVENQKTVIEYINKNTHDDKRGGIIGQYYGYDGVHCTFISNILKNTEITFDQFKQYVLKENTTDTEKSTFVLPEIWWVRITKKNLEDVCKFLGFKPYEKAVGYVAGMCKHYRTGKIEKSWNATPTTIYGSTFGDEITTEQFRKYVLKKEPVVYEEPKDTVLQFNQIRGKGTIIVQVQCSEGGIYKIGDKITVFDKTSPNKGKPFTIKSFRWNNTKTKICAVTELHTPNGIGLDKIELYLKPKVEITHNFKIGDKISLTNSILSYDSVFIVKKIEGDRLIINNEEGTLHNIYKSVLAKNVKLVEPKQELSLLEQAKLKYPVGTKYIPTLRSLSKKLEISSGSFIETPDFIINAVNGTSLYNKYIGKWAEIVEDFVLPEKWCIRLNLENVNIVGKWFNENSQTRIYDYHKLTLDSVSTIYNILHYPAYKYLGLTKHGDTINKIENGYTEITFEQFKKHVLNEKV